MAHRAICCAIVMLTACAACAAQEAGESPAAAVAESDELKPCPPPEGACAEDVVSWVLIDRVGTWERVGAPVAGDPAMALPITDQVRELFATYPPLCSASATYRSTTGPGMATVIVIAFGSTLDSLGFFAAQRSRQARRVLLTSAGYRDGGLLHVYSGWYYLRVEVTGAEKQALPPDQYLAARLEVRLPEAEELPRIIRVMPRGWVNALTVNYEPTDLLGEGLRPMAASARQMVGAADMRLRIMEAPDAAEARRWYTRLLQRSLERGRAWEVPRLGEEAFFADNGRPSMGTLQDQYVAYLTTSGKRSDAEAIMRLVGTQIRITRPLPGDADGLCRTPFASDPPTGPPPTP